MFWAKPDEMLISKVTNEEGPKDPFKTTYVSQKRKNEVTQKPTEVNLFTGEPIKRDINITKRAKFTATLEKFKKREPGAYEEPRNPTIAKKDNEPLYSSFSPNKIFVDPLTNIKTKQSYFLSFAKVGKSARSKTQDTKGKQSTRQSGRGGQDNLILRVTTKKSIGGNIEMDTKKVITIGVRTGGFKGL